MAGRITLGYEPNQGNLVLSDSADFICSLTEDGTTWPTGSTCRVEFPDLSGIGPYTATVDVTTATASFDLDKTVTTDVLIPSGTRFRIYLVKGTGGSASDFLWFFGKVKREE